MNGEFVTRAIYLGLGDAWRMVDYFIKINDLVAAAGAFRCRPDGTLGGIDAQGD